MEWKVKGLARPPLLGSVTQNDAPQMQPARNSPKFLLQDFSPPPMLPFEKLAMEQEGKPIELHHGYVFHSCMLKMKSYKATRSQFLYYCEYMKLPSTVRPSDYPGQYCLL